ncbi:MAG: YCF48-related protein [Saprospiraceae bacterium]|nr:YCF48-related protein [Saprospiraceae bacterium]
MKSFFFSPKIAFIFLFFSACKKETIPVKWTQKETKSDYEWRGIQFFDAKNGVIIGGKTWSGGYVLQTRDGGETWQFDSVQQWCLYGLSQDSKPKNRADGAFFTIGISGQVFERKNKDSTFSKVGNPFWRWFHGIAARGERVIAVGGESWNSGVLAHFQRGNPSLSRMDTFPQELEAVAFADDSVVAAVGYGLVLRSENGGTSWSPLKQWDSGFYKSVCFPSEKIGYIVGYSGEILKTTDGGKTWTRLQSPNTYKPKRFNHVFFTDILRGGICGDNGVFWRTTDGGETWQVVEDFPKVNFYAIFMRENEGWLVGKEGTVIKFSF